MKRAPRSRQRHDLYAKYHDYDSEISDLLGECGFSRIDGVGIHLQVATFASNSADCQNVNSSPFSDTLVEFEN